jgi:hypothetical protein
LLADLPVTPGVSGVRWGDLHQMPHSLGGGAPESVRQDGGKLLVQLVKFFQAFYLDLELEISH